MKNKHKHLAALLLVCFLLQAVPPCHVLAYSDMTAGDAALDMIRRYESFSEKMYYEGGKWYVGFGSQVEEGAYPDGITEDEALALVRDELSDVEKKLNSFFADNRLSPTQAQFDALVDFCYIHSTSWLSGNNALVQLVRGDTQPTRLETAQAFGVWSHSGGKVLAGLARRHLEEAALYLDGSAEQQDDFVFLAVDKQDGAIRSTDFGVYERGSVYDAFPAMFLLGHTLTGVRTADGEMIHIGDTVAGDRFVTPVWEKNVYTNAFDDVTQEEWFYDYVMELNEAGVVSGRGEGVFDPAASVTVGEALKLILLAAGWDEQAAVGDHWASGYQSLGREKRLLPDVLLDALDQPITRGDVAELAAKAIGFGQSFAESPFADTTDGYAVALAGIGVLTGMTEHGESYFHPEKTLTRAEVSTIVWRLRNTVALDTTQSVRYGTRSFAVKAGVALNDYDMDGFSGEGRTMNYEEPGVSVLRGIDVSRFQGTIDWDAVREDGISFAILRVGGRFQSSGEIYDDLMFESNYAGASAAGLRIGCYFYSQAANTEEAVEEADYVLSKLADKQLAAPVVFDWETAGTSNARTNGLPVQVVCDCAIAFCERVKAAGYTPMIYMNTHDGYVKYDLSRLTDYEIWYAGQYNGAYPQFVYDFRMWQYTSDGELNGIEGGVDMDLWFVR